MSKERELLKGAVEWLQDLKYMWADTRDSGDWVLLELIADIKRIEELLAQPEPLTPRQGLEEYKTGYKRGFEDGHEECKQQIKNAFGVDDE